MGLEKEKKAMNYRHRKILQYFKKNPEATFICAFIFLIAVCMLLLVFGRVKIAEGVVNWAYLFLVAGILIKLVRYLKERKD